MAILAKRLTRWIVVPVIAGSTPVDRPMQGYRPMAGQQSPKLPIEVQALMPLPVMARQLKWLERAVHTRKNSGSTPGRATTFPVFVHRRVRT